MKRNKILNFVNGVEIQKIKDKGRGVFAKKLLKKGDLIIVERALAEGIETCE